jgi:hypothetical protein
MSVRVALRVSGQILSYPVWRQAVWATGLRQYPLWTWQWEMDTSSTQHIAFIIANRLLECYQKYSAASKSRYCFLWTTSLLVSPLDGLVNSLFPLYQPSLNRSSIRGGSRPCSKMSTCMESSPPGSRLFLQPYATDGFCRNSTISSPRSKHPESPSCLRKL